MVPERVASFMKTRKFDYQRAEGYIYRKIKKVRCKKLDQESEHVWVT